MPYRGGSLYIKVELYIASTWVEVTSRARGGRAASGVDIDHGRDTSALQAETSRCELTLGNADGYVTEGNAESPWYPYFGRGCRIRVSISGVLASDAVRFDGEIDTIVAVYPGGSDSSVRIIATGILGGQLGLGSDPLDSAPRRYLTGLSGTVPVAAWLLEDGPLVAAGTPVYGSTSLTPFVGGHPSGAVVTYPQWGRGTLAPWLPEVLSRSSAGSLSILRASVSMPGFTNTWTIDFAYASGTDAPVSAVDVNPAYLGGALGWPQLSLDPLAETVSVSFDGSPETETSIAGAFDGLVRHVRWTATQSGADVSWAVYLNSVLVQSGTELTSTLSAITKIGFTSEAGSAAAAIGYAAIWTTPVAVASYTAAILGYTGELPSARIARLCSEEGLAVTVTGTSTQTMGPQPVDTLANLLIECEAVDGGLLSDGTSGGGLAYRCLPDMYNQSASLAVTQGAIDVDVAPIWDNRSIRNDVTASRPGGSSSRQTDEAHVTRTRRRIKDSLSVNVETDNQLAHAAMWRVNIGTSAAPRYNGVTINVRNPQGAALADTILALEPGDRFTVAEAALPSQHPPGGIDSLVVGWHEHLDAVEWTFAPNCVDYKPYLVGVYGADPGGVVTRYDSGDSTLNSGVTSSATSLGVAWTLLGWTHGDGDFDIAVDGERMTVTAVAGAVSPQTFTVTRAVNGVTKAHSSGATVALWDTPRYAL